MKVYRIIVLLSEGGPLSGGAFSTKEKAEARLKAVSEDWEGPNVEQIYIEEITVE